MCCVLLILQFLHFFLFHHCFNLVIVLGLLPCRRLIQLVIVTGRLLTWFWYLEGRPRSLASDSLIALFSLAFGHDVVNLFYLLMLPLNRLCLCGIRDLLILLLQIFLELKQKVLVAFLSGGFGGFGSHIE